MEEQQRRRYRAIVTKYHGWTNTRGARISTRVEGLPVIWSKLDPCLSLNSNLHNAAHSFADKYGWLGNGDKVELISGVLPDKNIVWVLADK